MGIRLAHDGSKPVAALPAAPPMRRWLRRAAVGFTFCYATSLPVVAAVWFAEDFVANGAAAVGEGGRQRASSLSPWNAEFYAAIAAHGYTYNSQEKSSVAFFPAYPLLASGASRATGLPISTAMPLVAHLFLLGSFVLLAGYVETRWPRAPCDLTPWVLVAFGLFPTAFYSRMAYSESTFLFFAMFAMYGMVCRWRLVLIAVAVGAATAARPVGVALLAPFAMHLRTSLAPSGAEGLAPNVGRAVLNCASAAGLMAVACWGLAGFMAYQWWRFGDAMAFVKTQARWAQLPAPFSARESLWRIVTLAPLSAVYDPLSPCHWRSHGPATAPFNINFANPVYFLLAAVAAFYGARKKWLDAKECALATTVLLIPYVVHADRTCMASQGRFASVVFPMYLVFGQALSRMPRPLAALFCAVSAVLLAFNAALFVSWHWS